LNVQGLRAELSHAPGDDIYEAVTCIACRRVHLVNAKTGWVIATNADALTAAGGTRAQAATQST
jgi:hypothetical protein